MPSHPPLGKLSSTSFKTTQCPPQQVPSQMQTSHRLILIAQKFVLSAFSATVAESVTFPLDLTKTRMMLTKDPRQARGVSGMKATASVIVKKEGVRYLWRGCTPALLRQIVYSGSRLCLYELFRDRLLGRNKDGTTAPWKAATCSVMAGVTGQLIASPTDLIKVRMVGQGINAVLGKPIQYNNTIHAFAMIIRTEGVLSLWKGCIPNMQRAAVVNLSELATYNIAKDTYKKVLGDNPATQALSSLTSSFIAAFTSTPVDFIKTRIMYQQVSVNSNLIYKSSWDCLRKSVAEEGIICLWSGFAPVWLRMAPWSMVFWLTYERTRLLTGFESF